MQKGLLTKVTTHLLSNSINVAEKYRPGRLNSRVVLYNCWAAAFSSFASVGSKCHNITDTSLCFKYFQWNNSTSHHVQSKSCECVISYPSLNIPLDALAVCFGCAVAWLWLHSALLSIVHWLHYGSSTESYKQLNLCNYARFHDYSKSIKAPKDHKICDK